MAIHLPPTKPLPHAFSRGRIALLALSVLFALVVIVGGVFVLLERTAPGRATPLPILPVDTSGNSSPTPIYRDSDRDGLIDDEELLIKTDPLASDTDHDALTDGEEVKIYHTDPLSIDSDGDSYTDGDEVHNGYNPTGPGRLPPPSELP